MYTNQNMLNGWISYCKRDLFSLTIGIQCITEKEKREKKKRETRRGRTLCRLTLIDSAYVPHVMQGNTDSKPWNRGEKNDAQGPLLEESFISAKSIELYRVNRLTTCR